MAKSVKGAKRQGKKIPVVPLADRVLVKPFEAADEKTPSGIIIPDTAKQEKPERGIVVAVGEGRRNDRGELIPMRLKIGDAVMFEKYAFTNIKIDDEEYLVGPEGSVLAIIK
jgi:chaperonin GroES